MLMKTPDPIDAAEWKAGQYSCIEGGHRLFHYGNEVAYFDAPFKDAAEFHLAVRAYSQGHQKGRWDGESKTKRSFRTLLGIND